MRTPFILLLCAAVSVQLPARAQSAPALLPLPVQADPQRAPLNCSKAPAKPATPAQPDADRFELPSQELLQEQSTTDANTTRPPGVAPTTTLATERIAIWGDSHFAAGFFTEELEKLLPQPMDGPISRLIPANMARFGVRLPLRQSCVSPEWKYEPVYVGGEAASAPGPGMVNMVSTQPGATLAWDLRKDANDPGQTRVRILYQQTEAPLRIALSVDGAQEQEVTLQQAPGAAILELVSEMPFAQVNLRLIDAPLRLHGLELLPQQASTRLFDVFGYPGATVASWRSANQDYLRSWFAQRDYQLVLLEFGTNEGNVKPFNETSYRSILSESVAGMKAMFPHAACVLIGPGDRGVLVRRSVNLAKGKRGKAAKRKAATPAVDLFVYSRIHARIGQIQADVAASNGCLAWQMQDAMGGAGSAYDWAQQKPALMAKDLIHFSAAGYRRLAQQFARDMGWTGAIKDAASPP